MWLFPSTVELKLICRPSGDQDGESSIPVPVVICMRFCPSGDTMHSLYNRCAVLQTYAIQFPRGDQAGAAL